MIACSILTSRASIKQCNNKVTTFSQLFLFTPYGCMVRSFSIVPPCPIRYFQTTEQLCPKVRVTCRLGCGASMWLKIRAKHESSLCSERLVECKWRCGEDVRVKPKIYFMILLQFSMGVDWLYFPSLPLRLPNVD